jgi:hypothetical protein
MHELQIREPISLAWRFVNAELPHTVAQLFLARSHNGRHSTNGRQSLETCVVFLSVNLFGGVRRDGFHVMPSCPPTDIARFKKQLSVKEEEEKNGAALGINPIC